MQPITAEMRRPRGPRVRLITSQHLDHRTRAAARVRKLTKLFEGEVRQQFGGGAVRSPCASGLSGRRL